MITISNMNGHSLGIWGVSLSGSADFAITTYPDKTIPSGGLTDLEVTFSPSAIGYVTADLEIESNDPESPFIEVNLKGTGVDSSQPPSSVADILDFTDTCVADGTLYGDGPGKSAEKRLNALRNMIESAGDLQVNGEIDQACQQLFVAYKKTDGLAIPPDFASGPAASILAGMIKDLMAYLGCE